ncbi:hypothetical protein ACOMHN_017770 [Nucella lapillus]
MAGFRRGSGVHSLTVTSTFLPVLLLLLPLLHLPAQTEATSAPHIVVFMVSEMGWWDVGFKDSTMYTPNIDSMANSGVSFLSSYMQEGSIPSKAAFFSGYYPLHLGLQHAAKNPSSKAVLPLDASIFPENLQKLDYETYYVGQWHLGSTSKEHTPTYRGFDYFYGMYGSEADYYTHKTEAGVYNMHENIGTDLKVDTSAKGIYSTKLFTNKAVDIIKNHDKFKPMLLVVAYQGLHAPLQAPKKFDDKCVNITWNDARKKRCAMLAEVDDGVGKVMDGLKRKGMNDNLVTLVTSDSGGSVEQGSIVWPLRGSKGTLWEGGVRAVTLLHSEKHLKTAGTWKGLMHAVDWHPTILGMAGYDKELIQLDGVNNWSPIVKNKSSERWEFLVGWNDETKDYAFRYDHYKLLKIQNNKPDGWYYRVDKDYKNKTAEGSNSEYILVNLKKSENEKRDFKRRSSYECVFNMMKLKLESFKASVVPAL